MYIGGEGKRHGPKGSYKVLPLDNIYPECIEEWEIVKVVKRD